MATPDGKDFWTYTGTGPLAPGSSRRSSSRGHRSRRAAQRHPSDRREGRRPRGRSSTASPTHAAVRRGAGGLLKSPCGTDGRRRGRHTAVNVRLGGAPLVPERRLALPCTGWLVAGSNGSTMITTNHCFTTQSESHRACALQLPAHHLRRRHDGDHNDLQRRHVPADQREPRYTIFTLLGNPEGTWGEYTATSKSPTVGLTLDFPQHSGGQPQDDRLWKELARTRCAQRLDAQRHLRRLRGRSQVGYSCDSEAALGIAAPRCRDRPLRHRPAPLRQRLSARRSATPHADEEHLPERARAALSPAPRTDPDSRTGLAARAGPGAASAASTVRVRNGASGLHAGGATSRRRNRRRPRAVEVDLVIPSPISIAQCRSCRCRARGK